MYQVNVKEGILELTESEVRNILCFRILDCVRKLCSYSKEGILKVAPIEINNVFYSSITYSSKGSVSLYGEASAWLYTNTMSVKDLHSLYLYLSGIKSSKHIDYYSTL